MGREVSYSGSCGEVGGWVATDAATVTSRVPLYPRRFGDSEICYPYGYVLLLLLLRLRRAERGARKPHLDGDLSERVLRNLP